MAMVAALTLGCGVMSALAQGNGTGTPSGTPGGAGTQIRDRDRVQDCEPAVDGKRTRQYENLPDGVKKAVGEMKQAREAYQQKKQELKKELQGCTATERDQIRQQLRDQLCDQVRDREQLRERLQELREQLPNHRELMEQARERSQDRTRRGD